MNGVVLIAAMSLSKSQFSFSLKMSQKNGDLGLFFKKKTFPLVFSKVVLTLTL